MSKDARATLKLGQARGIAMVVPAKAGVPVAEYAPNLVKKSIVGAGHGDKAQVRMMIGVLLPKADPTSDDAADALAIAVTHAHHRQSSVLHAALKVARRAMIGKLKGIIDSYGEDSVILDVNGVGYLVHCSARTLQELPRIGEPATLSIETYVREDQIKLFGFTTDVEREWFRLLQTVQGVGAKVALSVLGTLKPADLASAIAMRDKAMVARTPGVGPKVAERIVTELKDKAPAYTDIDPALVRLSGALDEKRAPRPVTDAVSALVNLGYAQAAGGGRHRRRGALGRRGRRGDDTDPARLEGTGEVKRPAKLGKAEKDLIAAATAAIKERYRDDWQEVGAALRTRSGKIFTGVNLDAYLGRMAVCAEAVALGRAVVDLGDDGIDIIVAVRHPPPATRIRPSPLCRPAAPAAN